MRFGSDRHLRYLIGKAVLELPCALGAKVGYLYE